MISEYSRFVKEQRIHHLLRDCKMGIRLLSEKYLHQNYEEVNRIRGLKNNMEGRSCFIIGNGPSLRVDDLDRIWKSGIDSFGANAISDIFDRTEWRPTYYSVMDTTFLYKNNTGLTPQIQHDRMIREGIKYCFYTDVLKTAIHIEDSDTYFLNTFYSPLFSRSFKAFSEDIHYHINDMGSVTHFNIQIAAYLGYKNIYLYGMDNRYIKCLDNDGIFRVDNSIQSHFEGASKHKDDEHLQLAPKYKFQAYNIGGFADKRKNDIGYQNCKDYAKEHGIIIKNATRGGKLEVFERVALEDILATCK